MSGDVAQPEQAQLEHARLELLQHIDAVTEKPLIALSFAWLVLLVVDLTRGLNPLLQGVSTAIWIIFGLDFAFGLVIAPSKRAYLRQNWLTAVSLLLPALRILRIFRALRLLRAARAARSLNLLRLLTSLNRGMRALNGAMGRHGVGYVAALTIVVTVAGAAGMAFFESPAAAGEPGLANYGEALWWTAMIMTTMGSEYWPKTVEGRILGWLLSLYAFAIFGYITATIASFLVGRASESAPSEASGSGGGAGATALAAELAAVRRQMGALTERLDGTAPVAPPDEAATRRPRGPSISRPS